MEEKPNAHACRSWGRRAAASHAVRRSVDVQKGFLSLSLSLLLASLRRWGRPALSARCAWLMWERAGWDGSFPSQTTNSQLCVYCKWSGPQPVCDVSAVVLGSGPAHSPVDSLAPSLLLFQQKRCTCIFGTSLLCVFEPESSKVLWCRCFQGHQAPSSRTHRNPHWIETQSGSRWWRLHWMQNS